MKNFFLLAILSVLIWSCEDDIERNTPSIQGEVNKEFFRATDVKANLNPDGSVTIIGTQDIREIVLAVEELKEGVYPLGNGDLNQAVFKYADTLVYRTGGTGFGSIEISRIKGATLWGSFYFDAQLNEVGDTLNFNKGSFFGVPISNYTPTDGGDNNTGEELSCEEATDAAAETGVDYSLSIIGGDQAEIETKCQAYKAALVQQITSCGDEDGAIQALIDNLPCN